MKALKKYWEWALLLFAVMLVIVGFMLYGTKEGVPPEIPPTSTPQTSPVVKATWVSPPAMSINTNKTYYATLLTNEGSIKIEFFTKDAPKTVNNFIFLAREKFYNGLTFHRVIKDFMIQGGDPLGTGTGGPGYSFTDEFNQHKIEAGSVAMANAGANTNGSQFFIVTEKAQPQLDGKHTNFGKVIEGMETVKKIAAEAVDENDKPLQAITIENVLIEEK